MQSPNEDCIKDVVEARPLSPGRVKSAEEVGHEVAEVIGRPLSPGRIKSVEEVTEALSVAETKRLAGSSVSTVASSFPESYCASSASGLSSSTGIAWSSSAPPPQAALIQSVGVAKTLTKEEADDLISQSGGNVEVAKILQSSPIYAEPTTARVTRSDGFLVASKPLVSSLMKDDNSLRQVSPLTITPRSRSNSRSRNYTPRRGRSTMTTVDVNPTKVAVASSVAIDGDTSLHCPRVISRCTLRTTSSTVVSSAASGLVGGTIRPRSSVSAPKSTSPSAVVPPKVSTLGTSRASLTSTAFTSPAPARIRTLAASSMSPGLAGLDSTWFPARSSRASFGQQSMSPLGEKKTVECTALFMHQGRSWNFALSPEASVNEAVSMATQQVLKNVVETDCRLGEKLSIQVLPAVGDDVTVGEWTHRNMDQAPLVVIRSGAAEDGGLSAQQPQMDAMKIQMMMEEQAKLMAALQKQLSEQTAIIRNQALFISDLQERDRQNHEGVGKAVERIESELAGVKGQLLGMEETIGQAARDGGTPGKKSRPT